MFRPSFGGRALTVIIGLVCVVAVVVAAVGDGAGGALRVAPWMVLVTGVCWAIFWRPQIVVDDSGVQVVNVLRTIHLPWPSIQDLDTKWALTFVTTYGRFTAWSAPSPGVRGMRMVKTDVRLLSASKNAMQAIRPGDVPSGPSGEAATLIRRRWDRLRDAGHLDNPQLEHDRPPARWHVWTMAAGIVLVGLGLLGVMV